MMGITSFFTIFLTDADKISRASKDSEYFSFSSAIFCSSIQKYS